MTAADEGAAALRARMRADLKTAMKARRPDDVAALRVVLAAFDNAEAVPVPTPLPAHSSTPWPAAAPLVTSEHVAAAAVGLGSTEVPRRELTLADLHEILRTQVDEWTAEAQTYHGLGQTDAATRLRRQAELIRGYQPD
ncbi:GatB/YqeY domain-containing protein [Nakamurella multipartita]|uniref:Uncharacterized protein n=1 Tax=Nakamurella multipartita (strain ATCC 700099 / DSM 44233 / CIP 104796 / JCM 9543 / NBRC 105858 / Y-104) TaxID=479431 RepID=C8X6Y1_NAKMY|nr:hypothetical protein [Nakamurella multipartita]ACV80879.1 hypothetical protein Namu_4600 [Nakamurella multipartita DSM 44233]